jgi:4'-phosphopantetheinyl transferase EntD
MLDDRRSRPGLRGHGEVFGDPDEALYPEEEATIAKAVDKRQGEFRSVRGCARTALAELGLARPRRASAWSRCGQST